MNECMNTHTHTHTHKHTHIYIYIYMHTHIYSHLTQRIAGRACGAASVKHQRRWLVGGTYIQLYLYLGIGAYTMHPYIYIHIHIHIYTLHICRNLAQGVAGGACGAARSKHQRRELVRHTYIYSCICIYIGA